MADIESMSKEIEWLKSQVMDIGKDTDELVKMEEKEMTEGFDMGALTALMANKGIDPSIIALMKDNGSGLGGSNGGGFLILILLLVLLGGGHGGLLGSNGTGATGVEAIINGQTQYTSIVDALNGNRTAIGDLAVQTGASFGQVQSALCQIQNAITASNGDVKAAIASCCCNLGNKIDTQACQTRQSISELGYNMQAQFAAQTNQFQTLYASLSKQMDDGFCDARERELNAEIQRLRDINATARETANTAAILAAIQNRDTIAYTGTITGASVAGSGTLS